MNLDPAGQRKTQTQTHKDIENQSTTVGTQHHQQAEKLLNVLPANGNLSDEVLRGLVAPVAQGNDPPVTHQQVQEPIIGGNEPITHKDIKKQQANPFDRLPRIDLELNKWCHIKINLYVITIDFDLAFPLVEVKSVITRALHNPNYWIFHPLLNVLARYYEIPGGYPPEQYAAISLERIRRLYENKDKIIAMCKYPEFSQVKVMQYISDMTGMFFDVHEDPKETIRLIEDLLRVTQKVLLEDIPDKVDDKTLDEEANKAKDREAVGTFLKEKMIRLNCFPIEDVMSYDQFKRLREGIFKEYEIKSPVQPKLVEGEQGQPIPVYPENKDNLFDKKNFDRELLAYKKNAPSEGSARDKVNYAKYMSANSFKNHLLEKYKDSADIEIKIDKYLNQAINDCLLGCYLPDCDDTKDSDEKILAEEFEACRLNRLQDDKGHYMTANSFRADLVRQHPTLHAYNLDRFLQERIREGAISAYVLDYKIDGTEPIQTILDEEVIVYKVNKRQANIAIDEEMVALEKYLKDERKIFDIKGMKDGQAVNVTEADLTLFLVGYKKARFPKYDETTTYISRILDEELAAYRLNKGLDAPVDRNRDAAEKYLKDERNILKVKGKKKDVFEAVEITEKDLGEFLDSRFSELKEMK